MSSAPVVGSTVPLTSAVTAPTFGSWRTLAAACWTVVLPSSCTGFGKSSGDVAWPVELVVFSWMSAVDWYFGDFTWEYPKAAPRATTAHRAIVTFRRQRIERKSWKVSGRSLSWRVRLRTQNTASGRRPTAPSTQKERPGPRSRSSGDGRLRPRCSCSHLAGQGSPRGGPNPLEDGLEIAGAVLPGRDRRRRCSTRSGRRFFGQRRGDGGYERLALGDPYRGSELAEPSHRGSDGGAPGGHALVGLDRVEALGEGVQRMGHDQDVGVLEEGRDGLIGNRAEQVHVGEPA